MAFVGIEDYSGTTEAVCFAEPYEEYRTLINSDAVLCFAGRTSQREGEDTRLMLEKVIALDEACQKLVAEVRLALTADLPEAEVDAVLNAVAAHPGRCPLILEVVDAEFQTSLHARRAAVGPTSSFLADLVQVLGPDAVKTRFRKAASLVPPPSAPALETRPGGRGEGLNPGPAPRSSGGESNWSNSVR